MTRAAKAKQTTRVAKRGKPVPARETKRAKATPARAKKTGPADPPRFDPTKPRDVSRLVGPPLCTDARTAPGKVLSEAATKDLDEVVVIGVRRGTMHISVSSGNMVELDCLFRHAWETLCEAANGAKRQVLQ